MAPKNTKPTTPAKPAATAKVAPAATPKVNPTALPTQQIYSGEQERKAALAEVTALRRQFDTTTAKGAAAFAKSKEAQAALARLDAAKTNVGMRTSAQDLQALNTVSGRGQTQALNAPSTQYFQSLYSRPEAPPNWTPPKQITQADIAKAAESGFDYSKARYDWVWSTNPKTGQNQWVLGVVGALKQPPAKPETIDNTNYQPYASDLWMSGTATIRDILNIYNQVGADTKEIDWIIPQRGKETQKVNFNQLAQALPELDFSEYQEILYRLSLERDNSITIEDILDKYDELYGEG